MVFLIVVKVYVMWIYLFIMCGCYKYLINTTHILIVIFLLKTDIC